MRRPPVARRQIYEIYWRFASERHRSPAPSVPVSAPAAGLQQAVTHAGHHDPWLIGTLARDTSLWTDDVWVIDSTPVQCARSRETVRRSELAGWAEYGYCASHSRYFWGLRLHMLAILHRLLIVALNSCRS